MRITGNEACTCCGTVAEPLGWAERAPMITTNETATQTATAAAAASHCKLGARQLQTADEAAATRNAARGRTRELVLESVVIARHQRPSTLATHAARPRLTRLRTTISEQCSCAAISL